MTVLRPAHRKPLHPALSPCQSRCLSIQVLAAARWGEYRCPAPAPPGALTREHPYGGHSSPRAARFPSPGRLFHPRPGSWTQKTGSPLPSGQPQFPALLLLLRPRLPVITARLPAPGRSRRQQPPAGLRRRAAGSSSRPQLTPPAAARAGASQRPGRAPKPSPSRRRCPRKPPPPVPGKFPALHSLRTGAASAHAAPSGRRLPQHTPLPASPGRSSPRASPGPRPGPSRPRGPSAARRRHPHAPAAPSVPRPPAPPGGFPHPGPSLQILPRRLCSTRTSRLSSSPASGSAVAVAASEEAAAAGAAAAMVPPSLYRSLAACVAGRGGAQPRPPRGRAARLAPPPGPRPVSPRPAPLRPAPAPPGARQSPPPLPRTRAARREPTSWLSSSWPRQSPGSSQVWLWVVAMSSLKTPLRKHRPSRDSPNLPGNYSPLLPSADFHI